MANQFCGYFPPRSWTDNEMDWDALDDTLIDNLTPEILLSYFSAVQYGVDERYNAFAKADTGLFTIHPLVTTFYFLYLIKQTDTLIKYMLPETVDYYERHFVRLSTQQIYHGSTDRSFANAMPYEGLTLDQALKDAGYPGGTSDWIELLPDAPQEVDTVFKTLFEVLDKALIIPWLKQKKAVLSQMLWIAHRSASYSSSAFVSYRQKQAYSNTSWDDVISTFNNLAWIPLGSGSPILSYGGVAHWDESEQTYYGWNVSGYKFTMTIYQPNIRYRTNTNRTDSLYLYSSSVSHFINVTDLVINTDEAWNLSFEYTGSETLYTKEWPTDAQYASWPTPEYPSGEDPGPNYDSNGLGAYGFLVQKWNVPGGFYMQ